MKRLLTLCALAPMAACGTGIIGGSDYIQRRDRADTLATWDLVQRLAETEVKWIGLKSWAPQVDDPNPAGNVLGLEGSVGRKDGAVVPIFDVWFEHRTASRPAEVALNAK